MRNRRHAADFSVAVCSPQCHAGCSVMSSVILNTTVRRAWRAHLVAAESSLQHDGRPQPGAARASRLVAAHVALQRQHRAQHADVAPPAWADPRRWTIWETIRSGLWSKHVASPPHEQDIRDARARAHSLFEFYELVYIYGGPQLVYSGHQHRLRVGTSAGRGIPTAENTRCSHGKKTYRV